MLTPMLAQILIVMAATYLWLYLNGNEYTAITGGWIAQAWSGGGGWQAVAPSMSAQSNNLLSYLVNGSVSVYSGVVRATNAIDLTAISAIRVTLSANLSGPNVDGYGGQSIYLMAAAAASGNWPGTTPSAAGVRAEVHDHTSYGTSQVPPPETLTDVQYTLDVSGLPDGAYYVCVGFVWYNQYTTSTVSIKAVEMIAG